VGSDVSGFFRPDVSEPPSFGDVASGRRCGITNLIAELEIAMRRAAVGQSNHLSSEFVGELPCLELFIAFCHAATVFMFRTISALVAHN
jgi:hypothetical protein